MGRHSLKWSDMTKQQKATKVAKTTLGITGILAVASIIFCGGVLYGRWTHECPEKIKTITEYVEKEKEKEVEAEEKNSDVEETSEVKAESKKAKVKNASLLCPVEEKLQDGIHDAKSAAEAPKASVEGDKQDFEVEFPDNGNEDIQVEVVPSIPDNSSDEEEKSSEPDIDLGNQDNIVDSKNQPEETKPQVDEFDGVEEAIPSEQNSVTTTESSEKEVEANGKVSGNTFDDAKENDSVVEKDNTAPVVPEQPATAEPEVEEEVKVQKTLSASQLGNAYVGGQGQIAINSNCLEDVTVNGQKVTSSVYTFDCGNEATVLTFVVEDGINTVVIDITVNDILG